MANTKKKARRVTKKKVTKKIPAKKVGRTKAPSKSNIIQIAAAKILKERREMREHLAPFVRRVFETVDPGALYMHNWHIDCMCEHAEAAFRREIRNLIVNVPPRFLKSIVFSVSLPAWGLGKIPTEQFICGSYSDKLAYKHSVDTRLVVESEWYKHLFPETMIASDQNEKGKWVTTARGHRLTSTVGGTIIGEGANIHVIDDPHNPKKALSEVARKEANEIWLDQSLSSRFNDPKKKSRILVMQRLHVNDMTGHMLEKYSDEDIVHVCIEQEAKKRKTIILPISKKKIVREKGELIHVKRFGPRENEDAKIDLGTYGYAGQHDQSPSPHGGGRIKIAWFPRYKVRPATFERIVQTWDTASKGKEINNPSAGLTFGKHGPRWYLIDRYVENLTYPALKAAIKSKYEYWGAECGVAVEAVLIENKSSGQSLIDDFAEDEKTNLPIIGIEPEADKITRMETQLAWCEAGNLMLPEENVYPWYGQYEQNLMHYPEPLMWDDLDATSQFIKWERSGNIPLVAPVSLTKKSAYR